LLVHAPAKDAEWNSSFGGVVVIVHTLSNSPITDAPVMMMNTGKGTILSIQGKRGGWRNG